MSAHAISLAPRRAAPQDIPLVRQLLDDPGIEIVERAVDQTWRYASAIPNPVSGWHLYRPEIYTASSSALAGWLADPDGDLRTHNEGDRLMHELLFATHDYLHAWAIREVIELAPHLGVGTEAITPDNVEQFAYVQLLTEAAATVGLDYWYLSCVDLDQMLDIGSTIRGLTISYHERYAAEYRRFNPGFEAQAPEFFTKIAEFYCTGRFAGFDVQALKRSPRMLSWLKHELSYGQVQRRYTRQWLQHLSGRPLFRDDAALVAPVAVEADWQRTLTAELGQRLWDKVKNDAPSCRRARARLGTQDLAWRAPDDCPLDFRFTNFNALGQDPWAEIERRGIVNDSFKYLTFQVASAHRHAAAPPALVRSLSRIRDAGSVDLLHHAFSQVERLEPSGTEPLDLFILS
ncbi:MAG: hypothetical protein K0V04_40715 [Deltaproteobacteria bacterium]|nr:hypothetical protein [Deltaproteobacteria bacterium]